MQVYAPETELRAGGLAPVDAREAAAFDGAAAAAGPWRAALHAQVCSLSGRTGSTPISLYARQKEEATRLIIVASRCGHTRRIFDFEMRPAAHTAHHQKA